MSWLQKIADQLPDILYHASYSAFADSILQQGLIPRYVCIWDDCDNGVFLSSDPHEAQSYPETTDNPDIPDEYIDDIVVFAIDVNSLDRSKFNIDPHILWDESQDKTSWIYRGSIPPSSIINAEDIRNRSRDL